MYRELCNLHVRRTACYACIQCALRIYTHVPHSSFQVDCTHGMHCTQAANGHGWACIARTTCSAYAQVEIFPHLQDPFRSTPKIRHSIPATQHSSHTALPDEHCSGTKTPPFVERSPFIQALHAAHAMYAPDANSGTRGAAKATSPASSIYTARDQPVRTAE